MGRKSSGQNTSQVVEVISVAIATMVISRTGRPLVVARGGGASGGGGHLGGDLILLLSIIRLGPREDTAGGKSIAQDLPLVAFSSLSLRLSHRADPHHYYRSSPIGMQSMAMSDAASPVVDDVCDGSSPLGQSLELSAATGLLRRPLSRH